MARFGKREFEKLARKLEPKVAKAFLDAVANLKSSVSIKELVEAIAANDFEKVADILELQPKHFTALNREIRNTFEDSAINEIGALPKRNPATKIPMSFGFDATNPRAIDWVSQNSGRMIREITYNQRNVVREVLTEGMHKGDNPRTTAARLVGRMSKTGNRFGGEVGLTDYQNGLVSKFRQRLIDQGIPLKDVEAKTQRYMAKKLRQRAEAIARTETLNAINAGRFEAAQQAIDQRDDLSAEDVTKTWDSTGNDGRTRPDHLEMDGDKVKLKEAFTAPDGSRLMHPCDSSLGAHPRQTVQCRCWMNIRYDWIGAYKRKRQAA